MAKIPLSAGFTVMPVGSYTFQITKVKYDETFGKLELTLETEDGQKHVERYRFMKDTGELNDKAIAAFSIFARYALNDSTATEVDPQELIGCFIDADVTHDEVPSTKKPGENFTFARLENYAASEGFVRKQVVETSATTEQPKPKQFDINKLLDD